MKASCCDQFARCRRVMEAALCAAVRLFGFDWSRISEVLGVSANACKKRWSLFRSSYLPLSRLLHPLLPVASFPVVGGSFPLVVPCGRGLQRSTSGGRPWNFAVRSGMTGRKLTFRQLDLVRLWNLQDTDGSAMMLCNLKVAESRLRSFLKRGGMSRSRICSAVRSMVVPVALRRRIGMVTMVGDPALTITSSNAAYNYICFPGYGRFASHCEVASFLGINSHSGPYCSLKRVSNSTLLFRCLGETVHGRMSDGALAVARSIFVGPFWDFGSLWSGGLDELGSAARRCCGFLNCSFVAERDKVKLQCLTESLCPQYAFTDVADAVGFPHVSVLVATPPCVAFSSARRDASTIDAFSVAVGQVAILRLFISRSLPCVFIVEQSIGLRVYHPLCYALFCDLMDELPYDVYHSGWDAHVDFGSSHSRDRLIWVARLVV
jgi:hypothetical protein